MISDLPEWHKEKAQWIMYIYLKSFRSINNEYLVSLFEKIDEENTHDTREGGEDIRGSIAEKDENV